MEFKYLEMRWVFIPEADWTNGGTCAVLRQPDTKVGIALLEAGRGPYARAQRAPDLSRWKVSTFRRCLDKHRFMIDRADCTGTFSAVKIGPNEMGPDAYRIELPGLPGKVMDNLKREFPVGCDIISFVYSDYTRGGGYPRKIAYYF